MKVEVHYLAQLRWLAGSPVETVELEDECSLAQLLRNLCQARGGPLQTHLLAEDGEVRRSLLLIVNEQSVPGGSAEEYRLKDQDRVSLLPPISGG